MEQRKNISLESEIRTMPCKRKWYATGREPIKTVRFTDGSLHAASGTLEEIEHEMKGKFPDKEIAEIS